MHAAETVELAALVATHAAPLIDGKGQLSDACMQEYWSASKCRLDRWGQVLRTIRREAERNDALLAGDDRLDVLSTIEEVLTGEMLTRVWTAVLVAYDQRRGQREAEPVGRSILVGHLEARNRVLGLLTYGWGDRLPGRQKVNLLRRRSERWTDLLIGYLIPSHDVSQLAFDAARAKDFAENLEPESRAGGALSWELTLASLRTAFRQAITVRVSPNQDMNARIAASVLACFPAGLFENSGIGRSTWIARMQHTTDDCQGMIEDLLRIEGGPLLPGI